MLTGYIRYILTYVFVFIDEYIFFLLTQIIRTYLILLITESSQLTGLFNPGYAILSLVSYNLEACSYVLNQVLVEHRFNKSIHRVLIQSLQTEKLYPGLNLTEVLKFVGVGGLVWLMLQAGWQYLEHIQGLCRMTCSTRQIFEAILLQQKEFFNTV